MPREHGGRNTGKKTKYGRPLYEKDGEQFSERSYTFQIDDKHVNVPSVQGKYEYGEDELYDAVIDGKIKPTSAHGSHVEARKAAIKRSKDMFKEHRGRRAASTAEKEG
jgi:hypothetical protein